MSTKTAKYFYFLVEAVSLENKLLLVAKQKTTAGRAVQGPLAAIIMCFWATLKQLKAVNHERIDFEYTKSPPLLNRVERFAPQVVQLRCIKPTASDFLN